MLPIIVLSGGLATRLRPVTERIPKSLVEVNDKPFVLHQLELFLSKGLSRVHFCLGYLGKMVEEVVRASRYVDAMDITFSYDGEILLGTGGAIKKAFPYFTNDFFTTYGDSYLDISFRDVEDFYTTGVKVPEALMVVYRNIGQFDKSNVIFEDGNVFYSKSNPSERMSYIDYGVSILNKSHFENYPSEKPFDLSEIFETLSLEGHLRGFEVFNRFYEIGSFKGIQDISNHLKIKNL